MLARLYNHHVLPIFLIFLTPHHTLVGQSPNNNFCPHYDKMVWIGDHLTIIFMDSMNRFELGYRSQITTSVTNGQDTNLISTPVCLKSQRYYSVVLLYTLDTLSSPFYTHL